MRVLVVEDDAQVASFIRRALREEGYAADLASNGEEAFFQAQTGDYDIIILDLVLPKRPGMDVLRQLREDGVAVPILVITAKGDISDRVAGLDGGADDYLVKPFRSEELLARVRALLRRRGDLIPTFLRVGDLELDSLRRKVSRGSREIELSNREYAVLEYLMRNPGRVVTRTMLAEHVWEQDFDPLSNVIDVHIARLRRKIDDGEAAKLLHTVRGQGYRIEAREAEQKASADA